MFDWWGWPEAECDVGFDWSGGIGGGIIIQGEFDRLLFSEWGFVADVVVGEAHGGEPF